jgi:SAM-dependent methyltransferase
MDETTARALERINRVFYETCADDFSLTRETAWPGWARLLPHVVAASEASQGGALRVLDVGCGNARLARFLAEQLALRGIGLEYWGVDASTRLLALARERVPGARLAEADFARDPEATLPHTAAGFGLVALFGVLHCVAGRDRRRRLLEVAAQRVTPGGVLAVARWRFAEHERFDARRVAWESWNRRAASPIDPAQLEPGDHLLRWGSGDAVRYCHALDAAELEALTAGLPVTPVDAYRADGREEDLNEYAVFRAPEAAGRLA